MKFKAKALWGAATLALMSAAPAMAQDVAACLITKTDTNPFFVKMKEGAEAKAKELGVALKSYAGKIDGDSESQVAAIETCIADGAKGILIAASASNGDPALQRWRRQFRVRREIGRDLLLIPTEHAEQIVAEVTRRLPPSDPAQR